MANFGNSNNVFNGNNPLQQQRSAQAANLRGSWMTRLVLRTGLAHSPRQAQYILLIAAIIIAILAIIVFVSWVGVDTGQSGQSDPLVEESTF